MKLRLQIKPRNALCLAFALSAALFFGCTKKADKAEAAKDFSASKIHESVVFEAPKEDAAKRAVARPLAVGFFDGPDALEYPNRNPKLAKIRMDASSFDALAKTMEDFNEEYWRLPEREQKRIEDAGTRAFLNLMKTDEDSLNLFVSMENLPDREGWEAAYGELRLRIAETLEGKNIYEIVEEMERLSGGKTMESELEDFSEFLKSRGAETPPRLVYFF